MYFSVPHRSDSLLKCSEFKEYFQKDMDTHIRDLNRFKQKQDNYKCLKESPFFRKVRVNILFSSVINPMIIQIIMRNTDMKNVHN